MRMDHSKELSTSAFPSARTPAASFSMETSSNSELTTRLFLICTKTSCKIDTLKQMSPLVLETEMEVEAPIERMEAKIERRKKEHQNQRRPLMKTLIYKELLSYPNKQLRKKRERELRLLSTEEQVTSLERERSQRKLEEKILILEEGLKRVIRLGLTMT